MYLKSLLPTIEGKNVQVYIIHKDLEIPKHPNVVSYPHESWGGKVYNELLPTLQKENFSIYGLLNDDLLFHETWYEDVLEGMKKFYVVSPGYAESEVIGRLKEAYELSKHEEGYIESMLGSIFFMPMRIFKKIGLFDESAYGWEDIDWMWRMHLNGLKVVTLKRVTVQHFGALTRKKQGEQLARQEYLAELRGKDEFMKKHGYDGYRNMKNLYAGHQYFHQYRK